MHEGRRIAYHAAALVAFVAGLTWCTLSVTVQAQQVLQAKALARLATHPPNPIPKLAAAPIWRRTVVVLHHAIAYPVETRRNPYLAPGLQSLVQRGQPGEAAITVFHLYQGSRLVASTVLAERVIQPPRPEVVALGPAETSRGGAVRTAEAPVGGRLTVLATAYWADPSWSNGRTATGAYVHYGSVAVDPAVIPLGTRLYVPGYGYGVADDTGAAIQGDRIDLYFPTQGEALSWGARTVTVELLGR
jgi:3D (Asp-Asp-Asp) domain-containing protein